MRSVVMAGYRAGGLEGLIYTQTQSQTKDLLLLCNPIGNLVVNIKMTI